MALNVRNNGVTEVLNSYSSTADLNGTGVDQSHRINVRTGGTTQYVGVSSDLSHPQSSTLRIQISGVLYAALKKSKLITDTTPTVQYYWGITGTYSLRYGFALNVDEESNRLAVSENNFTGGAPYSVRVYNIDHWNQTISSIYTKQFIGAGRFSQVDVDIFGDYIALLNQSDVHVLHIPSNTTANIVTISTGQESPSRKIAISQDILAIRDGNSNIYTYRRTGTNTWTLQPDWHTPATGTDEYGDFAMSPDASYIAEKTLFNNGSYNAISYDTLRVFYRTGIDSWSAPVEIGSYETPTSRPGIAMSNDYIVCFYNNDNSNFYSYQRTGTNTWSTGTTTATTWGTSSRLAISNNSNYVLRGPGGVGVFGRLHTRTGSNTWNSGFDLSRAAVTSNNIDFLPIAVTSEGAAFNSVPDAVSNSYQAGVMFYWKFLQYT